MPDDSKLHPHSEPDADELTDDDLDDVSGGDGIVDVFRDLFDAVAGSDEDTA